MSICAILPLLFVKKSFTIVMLAKHIFWRGGMSMHRRSWMVLLFAALLALLCACGDEVQDEQTDPPVVETSTIDPYAPISSIDDISFDESDYETSGRDGDYVYYMKTFLDGAKRMVEARYEKNNITSVNVNDSYPDGAYRWATYTYYGEANAELKTYESDFDGTNTVEQYYDYLILDGTEHLRMRRTLENGNESYLYEMVYNDVTSLPERSNERHFDASGSLVASVEQTYYTDGILQRSLETTYSLGAVVAVLEETYYNNGTLERSYSGQGAAPEGSDSPYLSETSVSYYENGVVQTVHNRTEGISEITSMYSEKGTLERASTKVFDATGGYELEDIVYNADGSEQSYTVGLYAADGTRLDGDTPQEDADTSDEDTSDEGTSEEEAE